MTTSNPDHDGQGATDEKPRRVDRRTVLKAAGGTAVAVTAFSGTASAHNGKFFGCERVCSGTDGDYAVVAVDDGYECRLLEKRGPREDVPWDWDAHCYTAGDGEVVVGYVAEDEYKKDEGCWLCLNPNDCAETHYDDARAVRDALDTSTCSPCEGEMNISVGCEPASEPADDGDARDSEGTGAGSDSDADSGTDAPQAEPNAPTDASTGSPRFAAVVDRVNRLLRAIGPGFRR
ncbi:hypothetical protein [Halosimplex halobium]|uniref:hypothetical protein n=1 Tax=Halosimplex halobium TaxID=3396618 RepID=UPI003F54CB66